MFDRHFIEFNHGPFHGLKLEVVKGKFPWLEPIVLDGFVYVSGIPMGSSGLVSEHTLYQYYHKGEFLSRW